jgi:hypothetical protein
MTNIFEIQGTVVRPTIEVLLIPEFKKIWDKDETVGKGKAMNEFAYIEFMTSYKKSNMFKGYAQDKKSAKIIERIFVSNPKWKPNRLVKAAIKLIEEETQKSSPYLRYYLANRAGAEKIIQYLQTVDLQQTDVKGSLIHKATDVVRTIKDAENVLKSLDGLEKKVEEQLFEATKTKANKEINPLER